MRVGFSDSAELVTAVAPRHIRARTVPATGSRRTYKPPHVNAAKVPRFRSRCGIVKAFGSGISVPVFAARANPENRIRGTQIIWIATLTELRW